MQEIQVQSMGQEDPLEEEMTLQYSCLENPTDRGAWRDMVHGWQRVGHESGALALTPVISTQAPEHRASQGKWCPPGA